MDDDEVNGLRLPSLLVNLLQQGRWRHPGDERIRELIPFLREPVVFLMTVEAMRRESCWSFADDQRISEIFHMRRGSTNITPILLPWLDIDQAVFIAVCQFPGDDIGIALDYRTHPLDPRVVANDWWSSPGGCIWQEIAPRFSDFVDRLRLLSNPPTPDA